MSGFEYYSIMFIVWFSFVAIAILFVRANLWINSLRVNSDSEKLNRMGHKLSKGSPVYCGGDKFVLLEDPKLIKQIANSRDKMVQYIFEADIKSIDDKVYGKITCLVFRPPYVKNIIVTEKDIELESTITFVSQH